MNCVICGKPILPGETYMAPPPVDAPYHSPECPNIRPGSVRYKRDGQWIVTQPGDALYSASLFAAEQVLTESGWERMDGTPVSMDLADALTMTPAESVSSLSELPKESK